MPIATDLKYSRTERVLSVGFDDGTVFDLPAEYLRVESPSAEVQGHGPDQKTVVAGKRMVGISDIEPVGNYAVRIVFDDGHDSGLFTWEYLFELGQDHAARWEMYENELASRGMNRDRR